MTLERFAFEPTEPVEAPDRLMDQVKRLIVHNWSYRQTLSVGVHNLTPDIWERYDFHKKDYSLQVNPDGSGLYTVTPRKENGTVRILTTKEGILKVGKHAVSLPRDGKYALIVGPQEGDETKRIHGIVFHRPGPSPEE